jgi:phosphatidylglycerophosphate synthase
MKITQKLILLFTLSLISFIIFSVLSLMYLFSEIWYYPLSFLVSLTSISYFIYLQKKTRVKDIEINIGRKKCKKCRQPIDNGIKR